MVTEEKRNADQNVKALLEKENGAKGAVLEDLRFISENMEKGKFSKREFLCGELYDYIERIDLEGKKAPIFGRNVTVSAEFPDAAFVLLNQVLSYENAPLGKWPTKKETPVWRQVNVNLSTAKSSDTPFEEIGSVVAVKENKVEEKAALLRELLASNLVERASLLAKYDKPDDAFEGFDFYHGAEKNHAYAEYPAKWHRLRNEKLCDFSAMLTAQDQKILDQLVKLLTQDDKTMGRTVCDLGSDKARKDFYDKVLLPYVKAVRDADLTKDRIPAFTKAKEAYLAQEKVVTDLQASLSKLQKAFLKNDRDEKLQNKNLRVAQAEIEHAQKDKELAETARKPLQEEQTAAEKEMNDLLDQMDEVGAAAQKAKNEWNRYNDTVRTGFDQERELRASVGGMTKLLNKKKYEAVMEQADKLQQEAIEAQEKAPAAEKKMKELAAQYDELAQVKDKIQAKIENINDKLSNFNKTVVNANAILNRRNEEVEQIKFSLESVAKEKASLLESWKKEQGDDQRVLLDMDFIADLLSKDAKKVEKREAQNPWISKKYAQEQEKLCVLAADLHKAFAEASGCLAANLATLAQVLGYWKKDDQKIEFDAADREEALPFIWQSFSLFMPMLAVTLPSVGELFADVKKPGLMGLLAVADADKAPAENMIGAIYRGRKAVVFED